MLQNYISMIKNEFSGYNANSLTKDMMAGLTVAAMAIPISLAFGVANGADAASGMITAIISGFVISLLSGGFYQISGVSGATATIMSTLVITFGIKALFLVTFLAGIFRLIAGLLRLGKLISFIPSPVITGFTTGIAFIIALSQIDNFFGVAGVGNSGIVKLVNYFKLGFSPDLTTISIGVLVILIIILTPKKIANIFPVSLLAIILATVISTALHLDIRTVGEIPKTLIPTNRLLVSDIDINLLATLIAPAFSVAVLGIIESLLCGAGASRMTGVALDNNQELIAQGIGNVILPFFGGIASTAAISRTSVAIKSGAKTRLTGVFQSLFLLVSMFLLGRVISNIPLSSLAGVLMVTAWRMNDWKAIKYIFSHKFKGAMLNFLVTTISTVIFDLSIAILVGVIIGLIFLVARLSFIDINYEKVDLGRLKIDDALSIKRFNNAIVVYISGPMIFANSEAIANIYSKINSFDTVLFSVRGVSNIDISCLETLRNLIEGLRKKEIDVVFCAVPNRTLDMMKKGGLYSFIGEENFYWSTEVALRTRK